MDVAKPPASEALARLASGIEAGVIGGLAMLGLLVSGSLLRGHVWWETLNLLGSTFYGAARAFRMGPSMATISGVALQFTITGTLGALFGLTCGGIRERRHLVLLGMLAGVVWFYMADDLFWQRINPLVPLYLASRYGFPSLPLLSHAVLGACLGSMGHLGPMRRTEEPAQISQVEQVTGRDQNHDLSISSENSAADSSSSSSDAA